MPWLILCRALVLKCQSAASFVSANGVDLLPPLNTDNDVEQSRSGLSFVCISLGTDEFVFEEAKKYVDDAKKTIRAFVHFAERGPRDASPSAMRFTYASYAQHLFI